MFLVRGVSGPSSRANSSRKLVYCYTGSIVLGRGYLVGARPELQLRLIFTCGLCCALYRRHINCLWRAYGIYTNGGIIKNAMFLYNVYRITMGTLRGVLRFFVGLVGNPGRAYTILTRFGHENYGTTYIYHFHQDGRGLTLWGYIYHISNK